MKCAVSFLKSNTTLESTLRQIDKTDAEFIHVDIMDGKFVPNKTENLEEIITCLKNTTKPLDVHLMVENPREYYSYFAHLNVAFLTIHVELKSDIVSLLREINEMGFKAGLALNPNTKVSSIKPYLSFISSVLIMGVNPGKGAQQLIESTTLKIGELILFKEEKDFMINFDGGVNQETRNMLEGLDCLVAGSFICMSDDFQEAIDKLR